MRVDVSVKKSARRRVQIGVSIVLLCMASGVLGQIPEERTAFRVCQDPNNLPFSNSKGEGYEDKIAQLFARDLGLPITYFFFPQRMAFIRNTLRYKLPGADYPCDIVMSVPKGFDQVSATKPYYRSAYALVIPKGKGMDDVRSPEEFLALPPARLHSLRIGVYDRSPASDWLVAHNLVDQGVPYKILNADPDQYPGQIIENDLVQGKIDVAIVWGPIAGFFSHRVTAAELVVIPLKSEPGVKLDFEIAMGVRYGEPAWKKRIEALIEKNQVQIHTILADYGVPQLLETGAAPQ
jgi:mxaJ protein